MWAPLYRPRLLVFSFGLVPSPPYEPAFIMDTVSAMVVMTISPTNPHHPGHRVIKSASWSWYCFESRIHVHPRWHILGGCKLVHTSSFPLNIKQNIKARSLCTPLQPTHAITTYIVAYFSLWWRTWEFHANLANCPTSAWTTLSLSSLLRHAMLWQAADGSSTHQGSPVGVEWPVLMQGSDCGDCQPWWPTSSWS